jgi:hypothetical protein
MWVPVNFQSRARAHRRGHDDLSLAVDSLSNLLTRSVEGPATCPVTQPALQEAKDRASNRSLRAQ